MIEEKIANFRELLAKRDDIDAEIRAIIGEATAPPTPPNVAPKKRRPKESRKNWPKSEGATKQYACPNCGKPGHRRKTCPDLKPAGKSILDDPDTISKADWDEIKASFEDGVSTEMLKLSYPQYAPMEIRRAAKFDSYKQYAESAPF